MRTKGTRNGIEMAVAREWRVQGRSESTDSPAKARPPVTSLLRVSISRQRTRKSSGKKGRIDMSMGPTPNSAWIAAAATGRDLGAENGGRAAPWRGRGRERPLLWRRAAAGVDRPGRGEPRLRRPRGVPRGERPVPVAARRHRLPLAPHGTSAYCGSRCTYILCTKKYTSERLSQLWKELPDTEDVFEEWSTILSLLHPTFLCSGQ